MSAWFVLPMVVLGATEWREVSQADGIVVEARPVEGSRFDELRATTTVALPAEALCRGAFGTAETDPKEPTLKSRRLVYQTATERVTYDQMSAPIAEDRDYAVRTRLERGENGRCRVIVEPANELAPPPKAGVVRIEKLHAAWDFEPQPDGKTKVTYVAWADPNTSMPAFVLALPRQNLIVTWVKLVIERARAKAS